MEKRRTPRLSLDLLRGFHAAARHLSFTRAAQELCITQSAVSREVKTLEAQLGKPLFLRAHRALQLTSAGEQLYRAIDEGFKLIDAAAGRVAGTEPSVSITTTTALASLWLAPRLSRFSRLHPGVDVRVLASNEKPDLVRSQIDLAIRFVADGSGTPPQGERLTDCLIFPVCAPQLARDEARPLRVAADLRHHVRLDFETLRDGRPWSEWEVWFRCMQLTPDEPASTLCFAQYDQVIPGAIDGSGVALGALPHLAQQLRDGSLCIPFGTEAIARLGSFYIVLRPDTAATDATERFVAWLHSEVRRDGEVTLVAPAALRSPARRRATGTRAQAQRP
jgi:LysR family glycine cleavage system transcriptional activator